MNDIITSSSSFYDNNNNNNNEWITCYDDNTNSPYYYNTITGISQWESPHNPHNNHNNNPNNNNNNNSKHFLSPPGGLRPSIDSPPILKLKINSNSKLKLSFRGQNKIIPIINDDNDNDSYNKNDISSESITKDNNNNNNNNDNNNNIISKDINNQPEVQPRKQRPTVKLKGESLETLKKALSSNNQFGNYNQDLENKILTQDIPQTYSLNTTEIDHQHYSNYEQFNPNNEYISNNDENFNISKSNPNKIHQQNVNLNQNQNYQSSSYHDYISMAQIYQQNLPYLSKYFDMNMKCILCHMFVPMDILFPCSHRCICRTCLSLPPFQQNMDINYYPSQKNNLQQDDKNESNQNSSLQLSTSIKNNKIPCPVCKLIIKKIIPVNNNGTEENQYWDFVMNVGVDKKQNSGLDKEFFTSFDQNIQLIKSHMNCSTNDNNKNEFQNNYQNKNKNDGSYKNNSNNSDNENENNSNDSKNDDDDGDDDDDIENKSKKNHENKYEHVENNEYSEIEEKSKQFELFPQFLDENKNSCCNIQ